MADDADTDKSPTLWRLHSTPSTAGLSSHDPTSAGPTTSPSSPSPRADHDHDTAEEQQQLPPTGAGIDEDELLALQRARSESWARPAAAARPLSAPSHSSSEVFEAADEPTPRTFETAVSKEGPSSPPRSARRGILLASTRSNSSGYGWYEEDDEDGAGGGHCVGSIGRGHEAHLQVLGRYVPAYCVVVALNERVVGFIGADGV